MTERLYVEKPRELSFDATVLEVRGGAGRQELLLDRTAFYPTSGGQPHDTGFLDGARVVDVREDGEAVWHVVEGDEPFAKGKAVRGLVDEARRRDHREQHSGQHLLSAVLVDLVRAPTVAFHLGAEASTIDVAADKLSRDVLDRIEARACELIRKDLPVTARVHAGEAARAEAKTLRNQPEEKALASPRGLRVVEIAGVDRDACCGTHVAATGELGLVKVLSAERGKKGETRLTFVAGGRALAAFQVRQAALEELSQLLTTGFRELPARVQKLQDDAKALRAEAKQLREQLLVSRLDSMLAAAKPFPKGGALLLLPLESGDAEDARTVAQKLVRARTDLTCAVAHAGERLTLVLARGAKAPDVDVAAALKEVLASFGGKGGGQAAFAQGTAPVTGKALDALAMAERALAK